MKLQFASVVLALSGSLSIHATTLSEWTFETSVPTSAGPHLAEGGLRPGRALGHHSDGSTVFSNPEGFSSKEAFSATRWAVGDYWQFEVDTRDFEDISIKWDQMSSGTGPRDFGVFYSTDGIDFLQFSSSFTIGSSFSGFSFDLSGTTAVDDEDTVFFRITVVGGTAQNGNPIRTTGASRIDNFIVSGTEIQRNPVATPDVGGTFLLLSLALGGLVGVHRRGIVQRTCL